MRPTRTTLALAAAVVALLSLVTVRTRLIGAQAAQQTVIPVSEGPSIPKEWGTLVVTDAAYPKGGTGLVFQAADGTIRIVRLNSGAQATVFRRN